MISIDANEIEKEVEVLRNLINDYEKNYLYLFKELSDASFYWKDDDHARKFFDALKYEKYNETSHYNSIVEMYKVFEYIKNKYRSIGKKIQIDVEKKDNIMAKFNKCISETSEIISLYQHLDTSFCTEEIPMIKAQLDKLNKLKKDYIDTKQNIKDTMTNIINIENEVKNKLVKIDIEEVQEFNINQYLPEE